MLLREIENTRTYDWRKQWCYTECLSIERRNKNPPPHKRKNILFSITLTVTTLCWPKDPCLRFLFEENRLMDKYNISFSIPFLSFFFICRRACRSSSVWTEGLVNVLVGTLNVWVSMNTPINPSPSKIPPSPSTTVDTLGDHIQDVVAAFR